MSIARDMANLAGQSLATDAELSAVPTGRKNLLYNGAMQVAQRGTSTTGITGNGYHTADRWFSAISMGTWTQSIENDAPTGSGFRKSLKMLCTTANASPSAGNQVSVRQYLEGLDLQSIKKGTVNSESIAISFWVKSNVTGTYNLLIIDDDNSRQVSSSYTISSSATWEKKTIFFSGDSTGEFDNNNAKSLTFQFFLSAGSNFTSGSSSSDWETLTQANFAPGQTNLAAATNNYWQITGVQLEVGDTATDFEHKPYGVELAECQRYYQQFTKGSFETTAPATSGGAAAIHGMILIRSMRAAPTASITNLQVYSGGTPGLYGSSTNSISISYGTNTGRNSQFDLALSSEL